MFYFVNQNPIINLERVSGSWREIVKKISLLSSHNPSIYVENDCWLSITSEKANPK
jgi:hypothetical protein